MKKITKENLIEEGKRCFNFLPKEQISTLDDLLQLALKNYIKTPEGRRAYFIMIECFARNMANYIDSI